MKRASRILLIGSGPSAKQATSLDLTKYTVIAVNHGWMATPYWKYWFLSRDFEGQAPPTVSDDQIVVKDYDQYLEPFGGQGACGFSVMLNASYFALSLYPREIFYLGADMNYKADADGNTHIYGKGLDIKKYGKPDPERAVELHGNGDPNYLIDLYHRFGTVARTRKIRLWNLSVDPESRLPYPKYKQ